MIVLFEKLLIGLLLFLGFLVLFIEIKKSGVVYKLMMHTKDNVRNASEKRLVRNRQKLLSAESPDLWWTRAEYNLCYSGFKARFPFITVEIFIVLNVSLSAVIFIAFFVISGPAAACAVVCICLALETMIFRMRRMKNISSVNDNLLKFLDFLGSYSITSGELTGILGQIGRYVDEPLKSVLEECCYEAQTTGDTGTALLAMSEKIEHPQFKELARNMEINVRYCADFSALVSGSRRSMRDYLKTSQERKNMLREAAVNMALLLIMSAFSLVIVDGLIQRSIWDILVYSFPGRIALTVTALVICLFMANIYRN